MKNFLCLFSIDAIINANKDEIIKFIQTQKEPIDIKRGFYSFVENDNETKLNGSDDKKSNVITIISSLLHSQIESRVVIYVTAKNRTIAEKFIGYFATERIARDEVLAELSDEPRFRQIAAALQIKLEEVEFEVI